MTRKPTIPARRSPAIAVSLLAAIALLAVAGPGIAHDGDSDRSRSDDDMAGKIASFDAETRMLTIDLDEGGSVSGLVTRRTWIDRGDDRCELRQRAFHEWCGKRLSGFHDGDDDDGDDHGWWPHRRGSADDLVPGAAVEEALLALKHGRAFFWKIELDE